MSFKPGMKRLEIWISPTGEIQLQITYRTYDQRLLRPRDQYSNWIFPPEQASEALAHLCMEFLNS